MAVERLKGCDNVLALANELGIHQRLLYKWRDRLEPMDDGEAPPENSKERELRLQVAQLKRLVADRFRFVPMAEALSRVVPDSNRRMILSIRHGQVCARY